MESSSTRWLSELKSKTVALTVDVDDPMVLAKVSEQFARALAGLAMDDLYGNIYIYDSLEDFEEE